jgi:hypothetical protein
MASTKYSFKVRRGNIKPHLDIEQDIKKQVNGLFTCTLRVNQGNVVDYVNYRNIASSEYNSIFGAVETECEITLGNREGCPES